MAKRWVALLRGINVGGHSTVPMAGLKQLFEDAGFESVRTYINSGNVVFDGAAKPDAAALEASVQKTFGVAAAVVVRSAAELAKVAGSHPFGDDTSNSFVAFLAERPDRGAARRLRELDAGEDGYVLKAKELYVRYPNGQRNAKLTAARLERALGVPATMRNWNTVTKLVELSCGE
jgi:uncharacterized protein (DUF1697 family)